MLFNYDLLIVVFVQLMLLFCKFIQKLTFKNYLPPGVVNLVLILGNIVLFSQNTHAPLFWMVYFAPFWWFCFHWKIQFDYFIHNEFKGNLFVLNCFNLIESIINIICRLSQHSLKICFAHQWFLDVNLMLLMYAYVHVVPLDNFLFHPSIRNDHQNRHKKICSFFSCH